MWQTLHLWKRRLSEVKLRSFLSWLASLWGAELIVLFCINVEFGFWVAVPFAIMTTFLSTATSALMYDLYKELRESNPETSS
jgi:hypothetical protein